LALPTTTTSTDNPLPVASSLVHKEAALWKFLKHQQHLLLVSKPTRATLPTAQCAAGTVSAAHAVSGSNKPFSELKKRSPWLLTPPLS
jgi:hypothetical protein